LNKEHDLFFLSPAFISTLSDYMTTLVQGRHSGMDCRNPGYMDVSKLAIRAAGCPRPGGPNDLEDNLTK
jgi:hypothetical protein